MQDINATLINAFSDVLEQFAFLFADEDLDDLMPVTDSVFYRTHISFDGPHKGSITLIAPESICIQIAASMLGVEEDEIEPDKAEDAFSELLNVTCGKFLEDLSGPEVIFNLSVPDFKSITEEDWNNMKTQPGYILIQAEMVPLLLHVELNDA